MSQRSQRHEASSTMATHDDFILFIFIFDFNANGNEWILMESNGNMCSDVRGGLLTSADLGKSWQSVWICLDCMGLCEFHQEHVEFHHVSPECHPDCGRKERSRRRRSGSRRRSLSARRSPRRSLSRRRRREAFRVLCRRSWGERNWRNWRNWRAKKKKKEAEIMNFMETFWWFWCVSGLFLQITY